MTFNPTTIHLLGNAGKAGQPMAWEIKKTSTGAFPFQYSAFRTQNDNFVLNLNA